MISSHCAFTILKNRYQRIKSMIFAYNIKMQIMLLVLTICVNCYVTFVLKQTYDITIVTCVTCAVSFRIMHCDKNDNTIIGYARKILKMHTEFVIDEIINFTLRCFFVVYVFTRFVDCDVEIRMWWILLAIAYGGICSIIRTRFMHKLEDIFKLHLSYDCICNYNIIVSDTFDNLRNAIPINKVFNEMCCICLGEYVEVYSLSFCKCNIYYCGECIKKLHSLYYCTVCKQRKRGLLGAISESLLNVSNITCIARRLFQGVEEQEHELPLNELLL